MESYFGKKILLPSGARKIDLYTNPKEYGGEDRLIPVPSEIINDLMVISLVDAFFNPLVWTSKATSEMHELRDLNMFM